VTQPRVGTGSECSSWTWKRSRLPAEAISNLFCNAFHVYQAEIFPTALRATATSSTYSLSRVASGVMPFVLLPLLQNGGPDMLFTVVGVAMAVVAVNVGMLGPRTTGRGWRP
jgi:putative MFS transporter